MSNTHRAVIERSVPPGMTLIASGPKAFCTTSLQSWVADHPLGEFDTAVVLEVTDTTKEGSAE